MNTKISCRTYMAWDYDKEEEHLDEMSEKGWQLKKGGCFFSVYTRQPGGYIATGSIIILTRSILRRKREGIWSCSKSRDGNMWEIPITAGYILRRNMFRGHRKKIMKYIRMQNPCKAFLTDGNVWVFY